MEKIYNKLVRDLIPEIIKMSGETAVVRTLDEKEYKLELEKKLIGETNEVIESTSKNRLEELADVLEIIRALAISENSTLEEVFEIANQKAQKRGAFKNKIFLEKVISNKN